MSKAIHGNIKVLTCPRHGDYLAVNVPAEKLKEYLIRLRGMIGGEQFDIYTRNQRERDNEGFHVTVVSPMEYSELSESNRRLIEGRQVRIKLLDLGTAKRTEDQSYFVVAESSDAQKLRAKCKLGFRDFHITLGFQLEDVQGVSKDRTTLIEAQSSNNRMEGDAR